jgi:hypothetical protein
MGLKGLIVVFILFAFSFLVMNPSSNILPSWITVNTTLYDFTLILWLVGFAFAFIKFGFDK